MSGCGVFSLPDEVQAEVFLRLPVKSIGKFRCLSKQWYSLLSSPRFIKAHLARSQKTQKSILIHNRIYVFTSTLQGDGVVAESIFEKLGGIPLLRLRKSTVVGPCHGLILIVTGESYKLLLNPTTLEHFQLPESPNFALDQRRCPIGYGLGYDSSSDDYKVVSLSSYKTDNKLFYMFADIYSMKMKTWRRTDHYGPFVRPMTTYQFGQGEVLVNGALHWMGPKININSEKSICALDLGTEKFHEIPYLGSHSLPGEYNLLDSLIVIKGCLGIVAVNKVLARVDIWTMNKYGMADSWTKTVFNVGDCSWNAEPWCFKFYSSLRAALIIKHRCIASNPCLDVDKWMCYCYNDEKSLYLTVNMVNNIKMFFGGQGLGGFIYSESLVSPHYLNTQQQEEEEGLHVRKKLKA